MAWYCMIRHSKDSYFCAFFPVLGALAAKGMRRLPFKFGLRVHSLAGRFTGVPTGAYRIESTVTAF